MDAGACPLDGGRATRVRKRVECDPGNANRFGILYARDAGISAPANAPTTVPPTVCSHARSIKPRMLEKASMMMIKIKLIASAATIHRYTLVSGISGLS